ncbi:MAG TPA: DUF6537 domain-containing protein, partial [Steroidobacteraceae bacterium]|nr:DUF6537 domain-containing protein [Steroidobacteraceae bacterium]
QDTHRPPEVDSLLEATARGLALWMTFEDPIRVADLKTRGSRFVRVREEVRAPPGQLLGITEFVRPRVEEIAGTVPAGVGRWLLRSPRIRGRLARWTGGKQIRTSTLGGFVLLYMLAGLRRWRRGTLRFQEENARIEEWLGRIERHAQSSYALALEVARAQRLVRGYGDTHERGWRNFTTLMSQLDSLASRQDGALWLARLHAASLADEEGVTLRSTLEELRASGTTHAQVERVGV